MPSGRATLLLVILLLPAFAAPVEGSHPPDPAVGALLRGWLAQAHEAVGADGPRPGDTGIVEALELVANRSVGRGILTLGASDIARYRSYATFAAALADGPQDNGTESSRRAQRLYVLNVTADLKVQAEADLLAARNEVKAFTPKTADGLEWAILAGRLLAAGFNVLSAEYPQTRTKVVEMTNPEPDTSVNFYRAPVLTLFQSTQGIRHVSAMALDVLAQAKTADATGDPRLNDASRNSVFEAFEAEARSPRINSPDGAEYADRAEALYEADEWATGTGAFLLFQELRVFRDWEARRDGGLVSGDGLRQQQREEAALVDLALNETAQNGFPGLILRDAFASQVDPLAAISRLSAAHTIHSRLVQTTVGGSEPGDATTGTLVLIGIGVAVVGVGAVLVLRRK